MPDIKLLLAANHFFTQFERITDMQNLFKFIALFLSLYLLGGCSKLTPENFDKIKTDMGYAQVVELLGDPSRCDTLLIAKSCVWEDGKKKIDIKFVADKVVLTSSSGL